MLLEKAVGVLTSSAEASHIELLRTHSSLVKVTKPLMIAILLISGTWRPERLHHSDHEACILENRHVSEQANKMHNLEIRSLALWPAQIYRTSQYGAEAKIRQLFLLHR
jgi:hypothetical protein